MGTNARRSGIQLTVLERLAQRYADHEALWGIEVLNEPITDGEVWHSMNPMDRFPPRDLALAKGSAPISLDFLKTFIKMPIEECATI